MKSNPKKRKRFSVWQRTKMPNKKCPICLKQFEDTTDVSNLRDHYERCLIKQ